MAKKSKSDAEPRVWWTFRFPQDVYDDLDALRDGGKVEMRPLFHKLTGERLPGTIKALRQLGFAPVPIGRDERPRRRAMRIRLAQRTFDTLNEAGEKVGLDPATVLYLLIRAEAARLPIPH